MIESSRSKLEEHSNRSIIRAFRASAAAAAAFCDTRGSRVDAANGPEIPSLPISDSFCLYVLMVSSRFHDVSMFGILRGGSAGARSMSQRRKEGETLARSFSSSCSPNCNARVFPLSFLSFSFSLARSRHPPKITLIFAR